MNLNALFAALHGNQWILAGAIFAGSVVALLKQGWAGAWVAGKLPPAARPYFAVVLGAVGLSATEIASGKPFWPSLIDGVQSGILAVFGHETVIEGLRSGKELIPDKTDKKAPA